MCVVSMISDDWLDKWPKNPLNPTPGYEWHSITPAISRYEFEALKKEVEELKKLLEAAAQFDKATGQKDCHKSENIEILKKIAKALDIDLSGIL